MRGAGDARGIKYVPGVAANGVALRARLPRRVRVRGRFGLDAQMDARLHLFEEASRVRLEFG